MRIDSTAGVIALALSAAVSAYPQASPNVIPKMPPQAEAAAAPDISKLETQLARDKKILQDWANLSRYRAENAALAASSPHENRVVFMGDSITDAWGRSRGTFFPNKPYVNRGISGQTTPQMLVRFRPDVIALKPKVVVILAGTNDLAGNTGPETIQDIVGNLASMTELAQANHIRVVLSSVTPVSDYIKPQTQRRPPEKIVQLNKWIKAYCARTGAVYLDYYAALLDDHEMLRKDLTVDGLHPNAAGYAIMAPLAERAIQTALSQESWLHPALF